MANASGESEQQRLMMRIGVDLAGLVIAACVRVANTSSSGPAEAAESPAKGDNFSGWSR